MDRAIGHALTRWQYIETALFALAHCLMEAPYKTSSVIFFHIRSAESKFSLIERLLFGLPAYQKHVRTWKALKKDFEELAEFRNALAHFEISWLDAKWAEGKTQYPIVLSAHHMDTRRTNSGKNGLFVEQILEGANAFNRYTERMIEFVAELFPDIEQRSEQLPPPLRQILLTHFHRNVTVEQPPPQGGSSPP
jgi:hypothetical protein